MQRERGELVPTGEVFGGLDGPATTPQLPWGQSLVGIAGHEIRGVELHGGAIRSEPPGPETCRGRAHSRHQLPEPHESLPDHLQGHLPGVGDSQHPPPALPRSRRLSPASLVAGLRHRTQGRHLAQTPIGSNTESTSVGHFTTLVRGQFLADATDVPAVSATAKQQWHNEEA